MPLQDDVKKLNSVFVEFETVGDAQAAYQSLTHHQILHMAPRYTGINPEEGRSERSTNMRPRTMLWLVELD